MDKSNYEQTQFHANNQAVLCAIFRPTLTKQYYVC